MAKRKIIAAMTFLSLFTGIGGFDLGFERAGMKCVGQVEINASCQKLLKAKWPDVPKWEDVTEFKGNYLNERPDVICFGSPCQDLSVAGRRAGLSGERSGLFFEAIRIVRELEPSFAVWENVPGAFSSNAGRDFALALDAFRKCGARDIAWRVLDAQYLGVAQRRRRVFVVADFRGERATEILFERESMSWNPETRRKERQKTTSGIRDGVAGTLGSKSSGGHDPTDYERNGAFIPETSHTLADATKGGANDLNRLRALIAFNSREDCVSSTDCFGALGSSRPQAQAIAIRTAQTSSNGCGIDESGTSYTLDNTGGGAVLHRGVRRLTPLECDRLQGFPDHFTKDFSDSVRYRMLGNAVCVSVSEWIGNRMAEALTSAILEEYA